MKEPIIKIEDLGKKYSLGSREHFYSLRDSLVNIFKPKKKQEEFWALKDVNLEIQEGEVVGIIGRNGAGKSTLLKILSRITPPTVGKITMRGRVASLLEVGTGFNLELTGRENIYLNGSILGMTRREINQKFQEIVEFSEIGKFLDTPVKHYSSGMYVRLAFAVAAHLEPEILIVDEVLAVGDAAFQKKCLGKMDEVSKAGRTVLFVSHNMAAIQKLCHKVALIDKGQIIAYGEPERIIEKYLGGSEEDILSWELLKEPSGAVYFTRVSMRGTDGNELRKVTTASQVSIAVEIEVKQARKEVLLALALMDDFGEEIFVSVINDCGLKVPEIPGRYLAIVDLPKDLLFPKRYIIRTVIWSPIDGGIDNKDALIFTPEEANSLCNSIPGGRRGKIALRLKWQLIKQ